MPGVIYIVIVLGLCGLPFALLAGDLVRGRRGSARMQTVSAAPPAVQMPAVAASRRPAASPGRASGPAAAPVVTCTACGRSSRLTLWRLSRTRPQPTHLCCPHCSVETPSAALA